MFALLALPPAANAQTLNGQITGTVVDSGGASVPGATVELTNDLSKQLRTFSTTSNGTFTFPDLITGTYSIRIAKEGFKAYESKGMVLAAEEKYDLPEIRLQVGDVATSISVEANTARVQTDNSDRISTIENDAVLEVPNPARNILSATRSIPGAQATGSSGAGSVNGGNIGNVVLQLDGVVQQDSGAPSNGVGTGRMVLNNDAVNEVQVQVNVMNAEFGDRSGGQVVVTTKNGTSQFHGGAYAFVRNEDFNANSFFNNRAGIVRSRTRFVNPGYTIGGPVLLPRLPFNRSRNKMYFFYAEDYLINHSTSVVTYTMPTALEKSGNFSNTTTTKGVLIPIVMPGTTTPFSGNIIPPSLISPEGAAMLNLLPTGCSWNGAGAAGPSFAGAQAPCVIDPTGNRGYNTQSTFPRNSPATVRTLRVDYNINSKTTMYVRLMQNLSNSIGVGTGQNGGSGWGQFVNSNPQNGRGDVVGLIHTFSPTLVTDFLAGGNFIHQQNQAVDPTAFFAQGDLSNFKYPSCAAGYNYPGCGTLGGTLVNPYQVFGGNYQNLIPNVSFSASGAQNGGQGYVSGTPSYTYDSRWPFDGTEFTTNYTSNWTNVRGKHTVKWGFNLEHMARNVSVYENQNINGTYNFGTDTANPLDTGYPISNMLTGDIQSYGQDNVKQVNHSRYYQYEWYLQDSWKVSRRVSLDYGMRFQLIPQDYDAGATVGIFSAAQYNASQTGTLLFPTCTIALPASGVCPVADTKSINPKTGAIYPGVLQNNFDPASFKAGTSPYSGIQVFSNTDGKIFKMQHPQYGPRFGFAWDVFGNGKMAVRGGFGIFYNRAFSVDNSAASGGNSGVVKIYPYFQSPTYYDTTFAGLSTAQPILGPQAFVGGSLNMPDPTTYSWSFGVQRDVGKGLVFETAYVANSFHHGNGTGYNPNAIAPDTVWSPTGGTCYQSGYCTGTLNPAFVNPTNTGQVLNVNLVRAMLPYTLNGISNVSSYTAQGESNYNSLQTQINKRFGKRLKFSSNWTWQKTQVYSDNQFLPGQLTKTVANRKQVVNIQLNYTVPSLTGVIGKNFLTEAVFDGWHIDAVLSYFSGNPVGVSCGINGTAPAGYPSGQDGAGSIPSRCEIKGPVFLPAGSMPTTANGNAANTDPSLWYPVNAASFSLPPLSTNGFGNAPQVLFWGPSYENEDVSVYKSFKIVKEGYQLQLRADVTNVRNHFDPGDPNTSFSYTYTTGVNTTSTFGQITSQANSPRAMAVSLRFKF